MFAVLATGPSLTQSAADSVRDLRRVVVNDAYRLAPDAEALVANDAAWWREHPEAKSFRGDKYCGADVPGLQRISKVQGIDTATNSGLCGLHIAILRGATRVLLFGLDLHDRNGLHFFGPHLRNKNPTPSRFSIFLDQFAAYPVPKNVEVLNCTPGSALIRFPFAESVPC